MVKVDYKLLPEDLANDAKHRQKIAEQLHFPPDQNFYFHIIRRNIDARAKQVYYVLRAEVSETKIDSNHTIHFPFRDVSNADPIHIIGAGPCGYFAALECLELGYKPIILERGKDVQARRRDLRAIQQDGIVNPDSNYCFGEGGAGTYSDGKLYTRSDKRGNICKVLEALVYHGANPDILIDVHPHIGSNKLPGIIQNIRKTILNYGGEVHFNSMVNDFDVSNKKITHLIVNQVRIPVSKVLWAAGHSARELFFLLHEKKIYIETKNFALGLRIEHPQQYIDQLMYHQSPRSMHLPAASYGIACNIEDKGVFSFCMCPGGLIVPAATAPGEIVVNGMSLSKRDSHFANSGLVTSVDGNDFKDFSGHGSLQALAYQHAIEQRVFQLGDGSQKAPAQRVLDFMEGKVSRNLPESSYIPGLISSALEQALPEPVVSRLKRGLAQFGKKYAGYLHSDAIVVATESRTSSPVKIPRNPNTCQHNEIENLYPAGEGAGYAGGILSAAMDGQKVIQAIKYQISL